MRPQDDFEARFSVDVRVVAATNETLRQAVQQGKFRAYLFFRLNVFPIQQPPLRQRRDDIMTLRLQGDSGALNLADSGATSVSGMVQRASTQLPVSPPSLAQTERETLTRAISAS